MLVVLTDSLTIASTNYLGHLYCNGYDISNCHTVLVKVFFNCPRAAPLPSHNWPHKLVAQSAASRFR